MEQITRLLKWIGVPLMALSGIIYALLKQNQGLKQDLNNEKAERAVDEVKRAIEGAKNDADTKESDYRAALQQLNNERDGR